MNSWSPLPVTDQVATAVLSVAIAATLGTAGCSTPEPAPQAPSSSTAAAAPAPAAPVLPDAAALTDILYRLADPAVAGTDKLALVEGATTEDAETIDSFANALRDNGFDPVTFTATAIGWSDRTPGDVVANVDVTPSGDAGAFSFPMDFHPFDNGWQLARSTAELLLTFPAAP